MCCSRPVPLSLESPDRPSCSHSQPSHQWLGMYSAASVLALAVVTVLAIRLLRVGRRRTGLPPGPPTIPILGNAHLLPKRDIHLQFQKWAEEYGPVYSLVVGTKTMIVLSSGEAVKELLDKRSAIYSDRQGAYQAREPRLHVGLTVCGRPLLSRHYPLRRQPNGNDALRSNVAHDQEDGSPLQARWWTSILC